MIELERTFLVKKPPKELKKCKSKEIIDIYLPKSSLHPVLRIRKKGNKFEMTKKQPIKNDRSTQQEQTIILDKKEFNELCKLNGKKLHKIRYYYNYNGKEAEIDVFQEELKGLILADFEFENEKEKKSFKIPDFCEKEVTNETFLAGGMLCGKSYVDIGKNLKKILKKEKKRKNSIS